MMMLSIWNIQSLYISHYTWSDVEWVHNTNCAKRFMNCIHLCQCSKMCNKKLRKKKKLCWLWVICHEGKLYIEITKPIRQTVALTNKMIKQGWTRFQCYCHISELLLYMLKCISVWNTVLNAVLRHTREADNWAGRMYNLSILKGF